MNRPEDYELGAAASHYCERFGIDPMEAREARANAIYKSEAGAPQRQGDFGDDGEWAKFYGPTPGGRNLIILCGPQLNIIAAVWPAE